MSALAALDRPDLAAVLGSGSVVFRHGHLNVIYTDHERHSLAEANAMFGVRDWRHMSVSLVGWQTMSTNMAGEMPLPSWYDLTHLVYGDHPQIRFDRTREVMQFLPPPSEYVNVAEALHLWQPR